MKKFHVKNRCSQCSGGVYHFFDPYFVVIQKRGLQLNLSPPLNGKIEEIKFCPNWSYRGDGFVIVRKKNSAFNLFANRICYSEIRRKMQLNLILEESKIMTESKKEKTLFKSKYITLKRSGEWEFVDRNGTSGTVAIIPITMDNKIILVEQYRPPVQKNVVELPAGLAGDVPGEENEDLLAAAKRELLEETGYEAELMENITEGPSSPGIVSEIITFFKATDLRKKTFGGGVDSEELVVHEVGLDQVGDWLEGCSRTGKLVDPKVYVGLYFAGLS